MHHGSSVHDNAYICVHTTRNWPRLGVAVSLQTSVTSQVTTNSVEQKPDGSSPHSQQPATGPYPEPTGSTLHSLQPISLRSIPIPYSHLRLGLPSGLFPSCFPTKTFYNFLSFPMRVACPAHLIRLDLTCLMISGDEYKL
jgi:hypothetical protein